MAEYCVSGYEDGDTGSVPIGSDNDAESAISPNIDATLGGDVLGSTVDTGTVSAVQVDEDSITIKRRVSGMQRRQSEVRAGRGGGTRKKTSRVSIGRVSGKGKGKKHSDLEERPLHIEVKRKRERRERRAISLSLWMVRRNRMTRMRTQAGNEG